MSPINRWIALSGGVVAMLDSPVPENYHDRYVLGQPKPKGMENQFIFPQVSSPAKDETGEGKAHGTSLKRFLPAGGKSGFLRWGFISLLEIRFYGPGYFAETDVQRHNPEVKGHA